MSAVFLAIGIIIGFIGCLVFIVASPSRNIGTLYVYKGDELELNLQANDSIKTITKKSFVCMDVKVIK